MLIHDLDHSEKIHSESPVFGGKSHVYHYSKAWECKETPNGKGMACKVSHTALPSSNLTPLSPNYIRGYITQIKNRMPAGLRGFWPRFF